MEEFRMKYLRSCDDSKVVPSDMILQNLKERVGQDNENCRLDLSGCGLSMEDCGVLAKCLAGDMFFTEIRLTDCLLTEEACTIILTSLCGNRKLKKLDLKGNNIRYRGADAVGKLLKRTSSLTHLRLEWNSIGMWDSGVVSIAEGLSCNQTLKFLNLRNNQISHEGATELSGALKRNKVLRTLDMKWNNIGIIGSRAFLSSLKHNKTITKLELGGNNIPSDLQKAIEAAVQRNSDRAAVYEEQEVLMSAVQQELTTLEHEKRMQVSSLVDHLAKEKEFHNKFTKSAEEKISQLKEALDVKNASFSTLSTQYSTCEANLRIAEQQNRDLKGRIDNTLDEMKRKENSFERTLDSINAQVAELKKSKQEEKERADEKIKELEKTVRNLANELTRLKEEEEGLRKSSRQSEIRHQEELRDMEHKYKKEIEALRFFSDDQRVSLEERLKRLENENARILEESSRLKSNAQADKLHFEEEKVHMTNKWKQEEMLRSKHYDERIELIQSAKTELQLKVSKQSNEITELLSQLNKVGKELDSTKNQLDEAKRELNEKDSTCKMEINRHRADLDVERKENSQLRERIGRLESSLSDLERRVKDTTAAKDSEISKLQGQLQGKQDEISRIREEDLRRTSMLESAFHNYISSAKSPYKS